MFCPKCGNNVPDGAQFCAKCGNKISAAPASPTPSAGVSSGPAVKVPSASGGVNVMRIVALVAAVIALIFACMPWLETSMYLQAGGQLGNALGQLGSALSGKSYSMATFDETYMPLGFFGLAGGLSQYLGSQGTSYLLLLGGVAVFWIVGVVLTIIGAIGTLRSSGKGKGLFVTGTVILALTAIAFSLFYGSLVSSNVAVGTPTNAMICAVAAIVAAVLANLGKKSAA